MAPGVQENAVLQAMIAELCGNELGAPVAAALAVAALGRPRARRGGAAVGRAAVRATVTAEER